MKSRYGMVKVEAYGKVGYCVGERKGDFIQAMEFHVCRCTAEDSLKQYRKKEREDRRNQKKGAEK